MQSPAGIPTFRCSAVTWRWGTYRHWEWMATARGARGRGSVWLEGALFPAVTLWGLISSLGTVCGSQGQLCGNAVRSLRAQRPEVRRPWVPALSAACPPPPASFGAFPRPRKGTPVCHLPPGPAATHPLSVPVHVGVCLFRRDSHTPVSSLFLVLSLTMFPGSSIL